MPFETYRNLLTGNVSMLTNGSFTVSRSGHKDSLDLRKLHKRECLIFLSVYVTFLTDVLSAADLAHIRRNAYMKSSGRRTSSAAVPINADVIT